MRMALRSQALPTRVASCAHRSRRLRLSLVMGLVVAAVALTGCAQTETDSSKSTMTVTVAASEPQSVQSDLEACSTYLIAFQKLQDVFVVKDSMSNEMLRVPAKSADEAIGKGKQLAADPSLALRFTELRQDTGALEVKLEAYLDKIGIDSDGRAIAETSRRLALQCGQLDPDHVYTGVNWQLGEVP
jgi:hypothetical protein